MEHLKGFKKLKKHLVHSTKRFYVQHGLPKEQRS
jgi:hypothetical protein